MGQARWAVGELTGCGSIPVWSLPGGGVGIGFRLQGDPVAALEASNRVVFPVAYYGYKCRREMTTDKPFNALRRDQLVRDACPAGSEK